MSVFDSMICPDCGTEIPKDESGCVVSRSALTDRMTGGGKPIVAACTCGRCHNAFAADMDEHGFSRSRIMKHVVDGTEGYLALDCSARLALLNVNMDSCAKLIYDELLKVHLHNILVTPGSISHHNQGPGGLARHTAKVIDISMYLFLNYTRSSNRWPKVDNIYGDGKRHTPTSPYGAEIVFLGALFHDIGKIREYNVRFPLDGSYLVGRKATVGEHTKFGLSIFDAILKSMRHDGPYAPYAIEKGVKHIIESHHGIYGEVEPRTPEAKIVHYADMIDSRLSVVNKGGEA